MVKGAGMSNCVECSDRTKVQLSNLCAKCLKAERHHMIELLEASDNNFSRTTGAQHYYKGVKMSDRIGQLKGAK